MSLPSSMADFVPCDRLLKKAYSTRILIEMLQSDWLSYSYTISHYSSPINFPLSSLVETGHVVRYRAGTICQQNALGRLSDDSARSAEVVHQRQLSPTVF